ncbi:hypothetical protein IFM89_034390 [Coptis chinensis]|uniref:Uncharacterized protein n=1 Tax=Coptis chinensis TaxID=261450 RepID=A0A835MJZ2_9MAGN|nr:hypothetical protein IFM89_034390 [Coptis chinensis]
MTRECMELPKIRHQRFNTRGALFGFGFDRIHKKYKVVCVYRPIRPYCWDTDYFEGNVTEDPVTTGLIITEGESSWRKLEFPYIPSKISGMGHRRCSWMGPFTGWLTGKIQLRPQSEYLHSIAHPRPSAMSGLNPEKDHSVTLEMHGIPRSFHTVFFTPTLVSPRAINFPPKPVCCVTGRRMKRDTRGGSSVSPGFNVEWALRKEAAVLRT